MEREAFEIRARDFLPRSVSDLAVYAVPLAVGSLLWLWVAERTGASEAWDEDLWWPVHFGGALVLGFLLGAGGVPYVRSDVPLVGFVIAGVLMVGELGTMVVTAPIDGAVLLPVGIVFAGFVSLFAGGIATIGVLAHRGLLRAVRALA